MAKEFSFPFTATTDEDGMLVLNEQGEQDRLYGSEDEAQKNAVFFTSGIMLTPDNQLRVDANGNMTITVRMGQATIQGRAYELYDDDLILNVPTANATYGRIDSVILSLDLTQQRRSIIVEYKAGTPSITPVVAPLIRTADRWELRLARVAVAANAAAVLEGNISDDRFNGAFCGVSAFNGAPIDVTGYVNQFEFELSEFIRLTNERAAEHEVAWQAQLDAQQAEIDRLVLVAQSIESGTWTLVNNNFDDWSVRLGATKTTWFENDRKIEEYRFTLTDEKLSEKITEFMSNGNRVETVTFLASSITVNGNTVITRASTATKITSFVDGKMIEVIS